MASEHDFSRNLVVLRSLKGFLLPSEKNKFIVLTVAHLFTSIFEIAGLVMTGILVSTLIRLSNGNGLGDRVKSVLSFFSLEDLDLITLTLFLSILTLIMLGGRTFISIYLLKIAYKHSGEISVRLSSNISQFCLENQNLATIKNLNKLELSWAVSGGSVRLCSGIFGSIMNLISDISITCVILIGLTFVDPTTTMIMVTYFLSIAWFLHRFTNIKFAKTNSSLTNISNYTNNFFLETLKLSREFQLRGVLPRRVSQFANYRNIFSKNQSYLQFLPNISKYVLEFSVLIGLFLLSVVQFQLTDFSRAAATTSLFLIASSRVAPGIFRIQQNLTTISSTIAATEVTQILLLAFLEKEKSSFVPINTGLESSSQRFSDIEKGMPIAIKVENLFFKYPAQRFNSPSSVSKDESNLFHGLSFVVPAKTSVALAGASGVGKSTLLDLILGFQTPTSGSVLINGMPSKDYIELYPGKISYVPQMCYLLQGTLLSNITLKDDNSLSDFELASELFRKVGLEDELGDSNLSLLETFGDGKRELSGGQLQRISLARALFTSPELLILDEYTSALDVENEEKVSNLVAEISANCTVFIVSHRRGAIFWCDEFLFLERDDDSGYSHLVRFDGV